MRRVEWYLAGMVAGALLFTFLVAWIANSEDDIISEHCDKLGAWAHDDIVYECRRRDR